MQAPVNRISSLVSSLTASLGILALSLPMAAQAVPSRAEFLAEDDAIVSVCREWDDAKTLARKKEREASRDDLDALRRTDQYIRDFALIHQQLIIMTPKQIVGSCTRYWGSPSDLATARLNQPPPPPAPAPVVHWQSGEPPACAQFRGNNAQTSVALENHCAYPLSFQYCWKDAPQDSVWKDAEWKDTEHQCSRTGWLQSEVVPSGGRFTMTGRPFLVDHDGQVIATAMLSYRQFRSSP